MFNKDFYPTPLEVIEQMTSGLDLYGKNVLEPSAGKGDIVRYCKEQGATVYACEIDFQLQRLVKSCCDVFLADDFLSLTKEQVSHIDYIIMNPPFSADEQHLLHAWEIAPNDCKIVSLINLQTYRNAYSKDRERLKYLIDNYGHLEDLGNAFSNSERHTNVNIGLVFLNTPISENEFESSYFDMNEEEQIEQGNGLVTYNEVHEVVSRYISAVKIFNKQAELGLELGITLKGMAIVDEYTFVAKDKNYMNVSIEKFKINLQKVFWGWIFQKLQMEKYLTKGLKETMNRFIERQKNIPFTVRNIYKLIELIVATHKQRMDEALVEIFDKITMHHHDNRYHVEGWKTNSHYLLRDKFILEGTAKVYYGEFIGGYNSGLLDDFVKVLCYITANDYNELTTRFSNGYHKNFFANKKTNTWYSAGFFEIKFFKKGTAHVKFTNKELCNIINKRVAEIKGYPLPESL